MPITIACSSCQKRLTVKDESAGKRVKCPGCAAVFVAVAAAAKPVAVAATASASAATPKPVAATMAATPAAPPPVSKPAAKSKSLIAVCPECDHEFKVETGKAGKKVTCPDCDHLFRAPSQPDDDDDPSLLDGGKKPAKRSRQEDDEEEPSLLDAVAKKPGKRSRTDEDNEKDDDEPRKKSHKDDDEEDDKPRKKSRKDDDDEEDDNKPRKKSRKDDDDEYEDDKPRKKSRKDNDDDDDKGADLDGGGEWGEGVLEEQEVPKVMRREIRKVLEDGEQISWATRVRIDILMTHAQTIQFISYFMFGFAGVLLVIGLIIAISQGFNTGSVVSLCVCLVFGAGMSAIGYLMFRVPQRWKANEKTRPCYLIAGRRLIIHPGIGMDLGLPRWMSAIGNAFARFNQKKSKVAIGVTPYTYADLTKMHRVEAEHFPGAGDIVLGLDTLERTSGIYRMIGMDDIKGVERTIREKVLHPEVDDLLSGGQRVEDLLRKGSKKEKDVAGEIVAPEIGLKDVMGEEDMSNIKQLRSALADLLEGTPKKLLKKVEAELTEGEEVLWVDKPGAPTKVRSIFGAIMGKAKRKEPVYTLYAITNRRALLWASSDTDTGLNSGGQAGPPVQVSQPHRGPLSYYPTDLKEAGLERDERIADGGNIVFKSVKYTITRTSQGTSGAGKNKVVVTKTSKEVQYHYFGILRIRNVQAVMRLLYDRLIAPCE